MKRYKLEGGGWRWMRLNGGGGGVGVEMGSFRIQTSGRKFGK